MTGTNILKNLIVNMLGLSSKEFCVLFSAELRFQNTKIRNSNSCEKKGLHTLPSVNIYCYISIHSCLYPDELEDYLLFMNVIDLSSLSAYLFKGYPCLMIQSDMFQLLYLHEKCLS